MNEFTATKTGENTYALTGALSGAVLTPFLSTLTGEKRWELDCAEVESISFSGIRALLNAGDAGKYFDIINANPAVAELFEATGASKFISVSRAPVELDMSQWVLSGDGHTAESFDSLDGDAMMKLYYDFVPQDVIVREKRIAQAAFLMGIPTPMPGEMVRHGNRRGCSFERLANKRSFARALSQEPERVEDYALRLAKMAKKLHSTPCDKSVFPSYKEKMLRLIQEAAFLSHEERDKLLHLLNSTEDRDTCIHGDLHLGNVITDGTVDLFIDMADFSYGNPLFDLGALYLLSYVSPDENLRKNFHIPRSRHREVWLAFLREYFGADTEEKLAEAERLVRYYSIFQALIFLNHDAAIPYYPPYIHEVISEME